MDKINYQQQLDKLTSGLSQSEKPPRLLLHSCCGPCSSYVLEYLSEYFEILLLYYNPNIIPEDEYLRRLETQRLLLERMRFKNSVVLIEGRYEPEVYLSAVKGLENEPEGGARCTKCFQLRLREAAVTAKENGCDYFVTTLTVSPHKNAQLINEISQDIADEIGIPCLPSDFKKRGGYQRSIQLSKEYGLYRQDYCGCAFC